MENAIVNISQYELESNLKRLNELKKEFGELWMEHLELRKQYGQLKHHSILIKYTGPFALGNS